MFHVLRYNDLIVFSIFAEHGVVGPVELIFVRLGFIFKDLSLNTNHNVFVKV
jgi:hypothetical protein